MRRAERDATFTAFVEQHQTSLRRVAHVLCGDWHRADDVLQTALVKAYLAWPRVVRDGREVAYVRRIVVRSVVDETRRPWRREQTTAEVPDVAHVADHADRTDDAVVAAVRSLPAQQRAVIVLRHWVGLSVAEVADELGIGEGTVKSHSSRAAGALRALLVDAT